MQFRSLLLAATVLAAPATANDLFVGSLNTSFARSSLPGGAFTTLGACGGQISALAAEGGELYLAATSGTLYRYRADTQQTEGWSFVAGETPKGLAIRGHELLIATESSKVQSYDRSRGTYLRQWDLPFPITTVFADRGQIYAGTNFGLVLELAEDGSTAFLGTCGGSIQGIAASSTELFLAVTGALVWRVDRATGSVTTSFGLLEEPTGLAFDQGILYAGTASGVVYTYSSVSGTLLGSQSWGSPISALGIGTPPAGDAYCFGDIGLCPCGVGDPFGGCPSRIGIGARLLTYGTASIAADDLELAVLDLPPTTLGRFYMGGGPAQVPFGNGLLCAGSGGYGQFRFPVQPAQSSGFNGAFRFGPAIVAHSHQNFGTLGAIQPGSTWRFQAWFRDIQNPCGGGFNTSNGMRVTFQL